MVFETLHDAAKKKELILIEGGMCHYHLRRDGQLTIREIIVLSEKQGCGIGSAILTRLKVIPGVISIFAKCPIDLMANTWYKKKGFVLEGTETTKTGRVLNLWRVQC